MRPTQSVLQSHDPVQFFDVTVQYKLFCVIKYNKILMINYYKKIK
jgi:hypothetical protein